MARKPFSFNQFDGANPTGRLFEKIMRDAVDYTKEIDDVFEAIVLTEPTLASNDANAIIDNKVRTQAQKDASKTTNYIFIVRIIGPDSPHNFLPDPIDFYVTNDEECKKRYHNLLQLHTKVSAKGLSDLELPSRGDQVQIKLKKSDYVYDTQWSRDFMGITSKATADSEVKNKLEKDQLSAKAAVEKGSPIPNVKRNATEYSGPLLVRRNDGLLTIGKWNQGVAPANFWNNFINRFQNHVSNAYSDLELDTKTNGATRDLASAAKTNNGARAAGSKHGAALALDLKIDTKTYGPYAGHTETNPKLARDKKLVNAIIDFMKLPDQENLVWGGTFGGGAKSKDSLPVGRGITEFHHFEFKDSYMPTLFQPYETDLQHFGFKSSDMTSTEQLGKLYEALLNSKPIRTAQASSSDVGSQEHSTSKAG